MLGKWYWMLQKCDSNNEDTDIKYVRKELEENYSEVGKKY